MDEPQRCDRSSQPPPCCKPPVFGRRLSSPSAAEGRGSAMLCGALLSLSSPLSPSCSPLLSPIASHAAEPSRPARGTDSNSSSEERRHVDSMRRSRSLSLSSLVRLSVADGTMRLTALPSALDPSHSTSSAPKQQQAKLPPLLPSFHLRSDEQHSRHTHYAHCR